MRNQIITTFRTATKDMYNAGAFIWAVSIATPEHPEGIILNKEFEAEADAHRYGVRQYHLIMDDHIENLQADFEAKVEAEADAWKALSHRTTVDSLEITDLRYEYSLARTATNEARETVEIAKAGCKIPTPTEVYERVEVERVEFEWVGWERWSETMISTGSKAHAEQPDNPNRALCGVSIPESGNGYEVGAASDYADGTCKRCQKAVHAAEAK